jgi:endoglucanase
VGDYDWAAVARFEIVAEHHDLIGKSIWFDNVHITNMDTAIVRDTSVKINSSDEVTFNDATINIVPNPAKTNVTIYYSVPHRSLTEISIYSISGKKITSLIDREQVPGNYSITWNCNDSQGKQVRRGIYFCRIISAGDIHARKIIVF